MTIFYNYLLTINKQQIKFIEANFVRMGPKLKCEWKILHFAVMGSL